MAKDDPPSVETSKKKSSLLSNDSTKKLKLTTASKAEFKFRLSVKIEEAAPELSLSLTEAIPELLKELFDTRRQSEPPSFQISKPDSKLTSEIVSQSEELLLLSPTHSQLLVYISPIVLSSPSSQAKPG